MTTPEAQTWIEKFHADIEREILEDKVEFDRKRADYALGILAKLDAQKDEANKLADEEVKLIEHYRSTELERLDKKRSWILFQLEQFMRRQAEATGEKSVRLVKGILSLRKGRDRIEIENQEEFMKVASGLGLLRTSDPKKEPDLKAILEHYRTTGKLPPGTKVIAATVSFSYQLNGGPTNGTE